MNDPNVARRAAGSAAADLVQDGMRVGLGSGSTLPAVIERIAERVRSQGLKVTAVPASQATAAAVTAAGIPMASLDDVERLDLAIDGADELDPQKNLLKGGGGTYMRERIVAAAAKELVVVVDESKLVPVLGQDSLLPVEVLQFGWKQVERLVATTGCRPQRRERDGAPFVSDSGNFILDCKYDGIEDPAWLETQLNALTGVVDHGLFVRMAGRIVVADPQGKVRIVP